jgi:hypothetical protein
MIRIPKTHKEFDNATWILKARGDDQTRPFLAYVQVKDGWLQATDGFRAHRAKTNFPEGVYEVISAVKKEIVLSLVDSEFPDFNRVFPAVHGEIAIELSAGTFKTYAKLLRAYSPEALPGLDWTYFEDAVHTAYTATISQPSSMGVVFFAINEDERQAVIMPLREKR